MVTRCPECGAPWPPTCEELFHAVLALDHARRPPWGPLHAVTVACFLLQHPSRQPAADRARTWTILQTYLADGLPATTRLTEQARRANSHRRRKPAPEPPTAAESGATLARRANSRRGRPPAVESAPESPAAAESGVPITTAETVPESAPPTAFGVTIVDVAQDGTFPAAGFADRVTAWARATVSAWRSAGGSGV